MVNHATAETQRMKRSSDLVAARRLSEWPRFLMFNLAGGFALGAGFTAALVGLDAQGLGRLVLTSDAPGPALALIASVSTGLAVCGLIGTGLAQHVDG
ncbi:hypothetical protein ABEG18_16575 [Alsobacter sp. KACC 23698]|uniref:MFS transporter n=1 Tax=Alsobacter sp. KACC 23698 TaxID=3149229 RepID=A0AAU7JB06_9HYPH